MLRKLKNKNGHPQIAYDGKKITVGDILKFSDDMNKLPFYGVVTKIVVFRNCQKVQSCNIVLEDQTISRYWLISLEPSCVSADRLTVITALQLIAEMNDLQKKHFALLTAVTKALHDIES